MPYGHVLGRYKMKHTNEEVLETLNNILISEIFRDSPRAQVFLKYVVTETLEGRADRISEMSIAQDVFGKTANFDSAQDTIVRVSARRLRYMLRDYYISYPAVDPVILTMPKGSYKIAIAPNQSITAVSQPLLEETSPKPSVQKLKAIFLAIVIFVLGFGALKIFSAGETQRTPSNETSAPQVESALEQQNATVSEFPMIAVMPFENQTGVEDYSFLEESLQRKLVEDLARFQLIRPVVYDKSYETLIQQNERDNGPFKYAISGLILSVDPKLDLYVKLVDLDNGSTVYEKRVRRSPENPEYFSSLSEIVTELSGKFAGLEGAIVQENLKFIEAQIDRSTVDLSDLKAFECVIMTDKFFDDPNPTPAKYKAVYSCLDKCVEKYPENATLLANFGTLIYLGAKSSPSVHQARSIDPDISAEEGLNMVKRAAQIDPDNGAVQYLLSATIHMDGGSAQEALKHAELAYVANPGDPHNMAWLSRRLASVGQWERALSLAKEAQDRTLSPPANYYFTNFAWALLNDDKDGMQKAASAIEERGKLLQFSISIFGCGGE